MRVLLVGGHKHGEWFEYDGPKYGAIRTLAPRNYLRAADPFEPAEVPLPTEDYRLERVPFNIEGFKALIWVGVHQDLWGKDKTLALIRAVFQRDIAEQFREGEWDDFV